MKRDEIADDREPPEPPTPSGWGVLASSLGCFATALLVFLTSLLVSAVSYWFFLVLLIPIGLVALAAYLNFGPKPKTRDDDD